LRLCPRSHTCDLLTAGNEKLGSLLPNFINASGPKSFITLLPLAKAGRPQHNVQSHSSLVPRAIIKGTLGVLISLSVVLAVFLNCPQERLGSLRARGAGPQHDNCQLTQPQKFQQTSVGSLRRVLHAVCPRKRSETTRIFPIRLCWPAVCPSAVRCPFTFLGRIFFTSLHRVCCFFRPFGALAASPPFRFSFQQRSELKPASSQEASKLGDAPALLQSYPISGATRSAHSRGCPGHCTYTHSSFRSVLKDLSTLPSGRFVALTAPRQWKNSARSNCIIPDGGLCWLKPGIFTSSRYKPKWPTASCNHNRIYSCALAHTSRVRAAVSLQYARLQQQMCLSLASPSRNTSRRIQINLLR
jgi:hypothetical protein